MDNTNKLLYIIQVGGYIKDITFYDPTDAWCDKSIKIHTENGDIDIMSMHVPNCCEQVYADFNSIKNHIEDIKKVPIEKIQIKSVDKMGLLFYFKPVVKVFVPCYNVQNGYYSSELILRIKQLDTCIHLDINDSVPEYHNDEKDCF